MSQGPISIAITTHNRLADLRNTLRVLENFESDFDELLICADGCTDGTRDYVRQHYRNCVLFENNPGKGSIPSRNHMIRNARSKYVLLLDDDSYPIEPQFLKECVQVLDQNPNIGVLTFPQRSDEFPESLNQADFGPVMKVGTFTSSGSVIRKSLFLELGGFPDFFFHAYEEPDYSLRVIAAGFDVVLWTPLSVRHHYTQTNRNEIRTHHRHARNELWSTIMRAPAILLPFLVPYRVFSQARYAASRGWSWLFSEPAWWVDCLRKLFLAFKHRRPVDKQSYRKWVELVREPEPCK